MEEKLKRGKNVLITFIGAGSAQDTRYAAFESVDGHEGEYKIKEDRKSGEIATYGYPFLAKINEESFDQIVFIGTVGSKWDSLQDNIASLIKHDKDSCEVRKQNILNYENLNEYEVLLKSNINTYLSEVRNEESNIDINVIIIKEGRTEKENKDNIELIKEKLMQIDIARITLDVTNSFRTHPMYVLSIINNIFSVSNTVIPLNIYYGMYDGKVECAKENSDTFWATQDRSGIAPMVDLRDITRLDRWTSAVNEFSSNGSVLQILELLEQCKNEDIDVDEYIRTFELFSFAVNSNNLLMFEKAIQSIHDLKKIIQGKKNCTQKNYICSKKQVPIYMQRNLERVISQIWKQFDWGESGEITKYSSYMFSLADWYLKQNRLGDSVRTYQEAIITFVMEMYPLQIYKLLEKRIVDFKTTYKTWTSENESEIIHFIKDKNLFDDKIRNIIRKTLFEDETLLEGRENELENWKDWLKEYNYMKQYVHNPDSLLYNQNVIQKISETNIHEAKKCIIRFAEKMNRERESQLVVVGERALQRRIDYLLQINCYDVFISYRRSYHDDNGKRLNDGVLLATTLSDYLKKKGLRVFTDKRKLMGIEGKFTQHLHNSLINSKLCLVLLGKNAYSRDYDIENDEFYKEITTAVNNNMKIAVICMSDFYMEDGITVNYGKGVEEQKELMKVVNELQRVGAEFSDRWSYENILSLRKCTYDEIRKILEIGYTK